MLRFIIRRLIITIPTILVVMTITWGLIRLAPGNFYTSEKNIPAAIEKNIREKYGLDKPWYEQYRRTMWGIVRHFDFGTSLKYEGQSVNAIIARSLPVSATIGILAYLLALVVGVSLALVFTWSKLLEAFFMPLLVSLNMIPKVALGPLIIVWFKYGVFPNSIMAFSIAVFPILLTTARGLREIEPELLDLVRSLKGSRWQLFTKIQLPGALPYIFAGMKVGAILAVAGAIVGEFLGSDKGLGYLMLQVQVTLDTPAMFMAVIMITALGMLLYGLVLLLERLLVVKDARVA